MKQCPFCDAALRDGDHSCHRCGEEYDASVPLRTNLTGSVQKETFDGEMATEELRTILMSRKNRVVVWTIGLFSALVVPIICFFYGGYLACADPMAESSTAAIPLIVGIVLPLLGPIVVAAYVSAWGRFFLSVLAWLVLAGIVIYAFPSMVTFAAPLDLILILAMDRAIVQARQQQKKTLSSSAT